MNGDTAETTPAADRHKLGAVLRQLREARSLRLGDAATGLDLAPSTLSRIETGHAPARTAYLTVLLDLYGVIDQAQRDQLADLARGGQRKSWWTEHSDLLPPGAGEFLDLEAAAQRIRSYSASLIPGLAQTPDYAAAVIQATRPSLTSAQVTHLALIQQRRQAMIRRHPVAHRHFIIDETALLLPVGTARIMADQIACLATLASDPAVTLQVVAMTTARTVISPAFDLLSADDPADPDVSCSAGPAGQKVLTRRQPDVRAASATFDLLASLALPAANSTCLIDKAAMWWGQQASHGT